MAPTPRMTTTNALAKLLPPHETFATVLEHGSLTVEVYRPRGADLQQPHNRDEVYVVIAGTGVFEQAGELRPFEAGEVIFVPAWQEHRFVEFSADFATWVIFFGPIGGEAHREA